MDYNRSPCRRFVISESLRDVNKRLRIERIIELLATPSSIKFVANELGLNYYTVRKDITDLVNAGVISSTGVWQDGAALYSARPAHAVPIFRIKANKSEADLISLAQSWVESGFPTPNSAAMAANFPKVYLELLEIARQLDSKEISEAAAQDGLNEIRNTLTKTHQMLDSLADLISQFRNNDILWNPQLLTQMPVDVRFHAIDVRNLYEQMLRHFSSDDV